MHDCTILRLPAVQAKSGYSRSTIYVRINQGLWTKPIHLGERSIGWPLHEVVVLNQARVAGLSDNEIRLLVKTLEAERKKASRNLSPYCADYQLNDSVHDSPAKLKAMIELTRSRPDTFTN
ncbi:MAG: AlpA family phage regulatory protein [Gammaproteobacteria bacterium]|nr:AlpA family phage regulatory protein [Gammaproteobacteria bacterium]